MWLALRHCLIRKVKVMGYQHNKKTSSAMVQGAGNERWVVGKYNKVRRSL